MAIHPNFADWYRSASVVPSSEELQKRWVAIEALAKKPNKKGVLVAARLFTTGIEDSTDATQLIEAFRGKDDTFPLRENSQLIRVLAGAYLRALLADDSAFAPLAALAICTGSFGTKAAALPDVEHLHAAAKYLAEKGSALRDLRSVPSVKFAAMTDARLNELFQPQFFQTNQTPNLRPPLVAALTEAQASVKSSLSDVVGAIHALSHGIAARGEEIDILWWLVTAFSKTVNVRFSEVSRESAILLLVAEFSDLVRFIPPPAASIALVSRALDEVGLKTSDVSSVERIVNGAPRDWRAHRFAAGELAGPALSPVCFAATKSLDVDGPQEWLPIYKKACGSSAQDEYPVLQLAQQLLNELLLQRQYENS